MPLTDKLDMDIKVVIAEDMDLLRQVYSLRYKISVEEMRKNIPNADHTQKTITDDLDDHRSSILCATTADGSVIGTMRLSWGEFQLPSHYQNIFLLDQFRDFEPNSFSFTSKLVIKSEWRTSKALALICYRAYHLLRDKLVQFNFCHCKPDIAYLYERLGYRTYGELFDDPHLGLQKRLVLLTEDINYFKSIRSMLYRYARNKRNREEGAEWFARRYYDKT